MADETRLYCICREARDSGFMIACDRCDEWYHGPCIGVTKADAQRIVSYVCPPCEARQRGEPFDVQAFVRSVRHARLQQQQEAAARRLAKRRRRSPDPDSRPAALSDSDSGSSSSSDSSSSSSSDAARPRSRPHQLPPPQQHGAVVKRARPTSSTNSTSTGSSSGGGSGVAAREAMEAVRSSVRRQLADALRPVYDVNAAHAPADEVATRVEEALAVRYAPASEPYKGKHRMLLVALRDPRNRALASAVLDESVGATRLVAMSRDELAPPDVAAARAQAAAAQLQAQADELRANANNQSALLARAASNPLAKSSAVSAADDNPLAFPTLRAAAAAAAHPPPLPAPAARATAPSPPPVRNASPPPEPHSPPSDEPAQVASSQRTVSPLPPEPRQPDNSSWAAKSILSALQVPLNSAPARVVSQPRPVSPPHEIAPSSPRSPSRAPASPQNPPPTAAPTFFEPPKVVWRSRVQQAKKEPAFNFEAALIHAGGQQLSADELPPLLQTVGRMEMPKLQNYLGELDRSSSRARTTLLLLPSTAEDVSSYNAIFHALYSRSRGAVCEAPSSVPQLKEAFLYPLAAGSPLPGFLLSSPPCVDLLGDGRDKIILVLVTRKRHYPPPRPLRIEPSISVWTNNVTPPLVSQATMGPVSQITASASLTENLQALLANNTSSALLQSVALNNPLLPLGQPPLFYVPSLTQPPGIQSLSRPDPRLGGNK